MGLYVDGFLLPIPKKNVAAYRRMSSKAGRIWREYGALEYRECVGDDLAVKGAGSFAKTLKCKRGETVIFAFIVYKSRAHRDRVNAKIMKDPRIAAMGGPESMPFDMRRMLMGGFQVLVDA